MEKEDRREKEIRGWKGGKEVMQGRRGREE